MLDFPRGSRFATHVKFTSQRVSLLPTVEETVHNMTIQEVEQIEDRARRGLPIDPESVLMLTAYLRDVLQAKASAEAVASEALKQAGLNSRYNTAGISPAS